MTRLIPKALAPLLVLLAACSASVSTTPPRSFTTPSTTPATLGPCPGGFDRDCYVHAVPAITMRALYPDLDAPVAICTAVYVLRHLPGDQLAYYVDGVLGGGEPVTPSLADAFDALGRDAAGYC